MVWLRREHAGEDTEPGAFAFHIAGDYADTALAERARQLEAGTEVAIEYVVLTSPEGYLVHVARGLNAG